jgi:antibiotic biosynthesis monooxygenase (ABM) superfamily enzyme
MSNAGTTIVTQTRPGHGQDQAFAAWQSETSRIVAGFAGFIRQMVIPPSPPTQVDWLILQHFTNHESALAWLRSDVRLARVNAARGILTGEDDVHVVAGNGSHVPSSPVSAVISTRLKPGQEGAYRAWEQRIGLEQAQSPGFQGYRLQPPIAGVQDDWLAIVRFDTEQNLQGWLDSPVRKSLISESAEFTETFHTRIARTGFDQWFDVNAKAGQEPPIWKQNMLVLLMLYPVVFLFGATVQTPWLVKLFGLPFPAALFIGNVVSIALLNYLVPWTSRIFSSWLHPRRCKKH